MVSQVTGLPNGVHFGDPDYEALTKSPGLPSQGILRVAANIAAEETVTIGADVYRVAVVNTDSTIDTANGELNNTNPEAVVTMAAHGLVGGDLIRVENEIMEVMFAPVSANKIHVRRGVSNTTIAAHANGTSIYTEATPGGGDIAVGVVTTLTPTVFTAALVDDINNRGRGNYLATLINANTVHVCTANKPGGDPVPFGGTAIAVAEDMGGAGNAWDEATLVRGRSSSIPVLITVVPQSEEVTAGRIDIMLPWEPTVLGCFIQVTATRDVAAYNGTITVTGNRITLDNSSTSDFAITNTIFLFVA